MYVGVRVYVCMCMCMCMCVCVRACVCVCERARVWGLLAHIQASCVDKQASFVFM